MSVFIGCVILLILFCGVVFSAKAISKRSGKDQSDAVYRDNYRYRNQCREEREDAAFTERAEPAETEEQTAEPAPHGGEEEEEPAEQEEKTVTAPGEDIKK